MAVNSIVHFQQHGLRGMHPQFNRHWASRTPPCRREHDSRYPISLTVSAQVRMHCRWTNSVVHCRLQDALMQAPGQAVVGGILLRDNRPQPMALVEDPCRQHSRLRPAPVGGYGMWKRLNRRKGLNRLPHWLPVPTLPIRNTRTWAGVHRPIWVS